MLIAAFLVLLAGAFAWYANEPSLPAIDPPSRNDFDAKLVASGEQLAAIGNCAVCHTAPAGEVNSGARPLETPFGKLYSTNITPDPYTGIGRWSFEAFARAMRRGVHRDGQHLYPAFPYDHFQLVSNEDMRALYAFVMTRAPVRREAPPNELAFPFGYRPLIAGWKLLYFRSIPKADAALGPEAQRRFYLVEGLGHCGACHTPQNAWVRLEHLALRGNNGGLGRPRFCATAGRT
jgi:mono/diheme cytochrome c family protein